MTETLILLFYLGLVILVSHHLWKHVGPFKYLIVSALLMLLVFTYEKYHDLVGSYIDGYPEEKFELIHHKVLTFDKNKYIIAWLYTEELGNRLYRFPYTTENKEKLTQMMAEEKAGQPIKGQFEKNENSRSMSLRLHNQESTKAYDKN